MYLPHIYVSMLTAIVVDFKGPLRDLSTF